MGAQQKWLEDHPVWGKGSVFLDELILVEKRLLTASQDNLPETKRSLGGWPGRPSWCARGKGMSWRKAHTVPGRDKLDLLAMFSPSTWPVTERKLQTCGPTGKALRCPSQNRKKAAWRSPLSSTAGRPPPHLHRKLMRGSNNKPRESSLWRGGVGGVGDEGGGGVVGEVGGWWVMGSGGQGAFPVLPSANADLFQSNHVYVLSRDTACVRE